MKVNCKQIDFRPLKRPLDDAFDEVEIEEDCDASKSLKIDLDSSNCDEKVIPEAEKDVIDNIEILSFETEDDINLFTLFEEKKKQVEASKSEQQKEKVIVPTKTKDITQIKGWRQKLFASPHVTEKSFKWKFTPDKCNAKDNSCSTSILSQNNSSPKSPQATPTTAFVSDSLNEYLRSNGDLQLNYLKPEDLSSDDASFLSSKILKVPELPASYSFPKHSPTSVSPVSFKAKLGRPKGSKNKIQVEVMTPNNGIVSEDTSLEVINETHWPDNPLNDDYLEFVYSEYVIDAFNDCQAMKKVQPHSFSMDEQYARYALAALQWEEHNLLASLSLSQPNENHVEPVRTEQPIEPVAATTDAPSTETGAKKRNSRSVDIAKMSKMISMKRSKRQIRLPSRFHESGLLLGNQWIIPDIEKTKTGKRRLLQEQQRLLEKEQRGGSKKSVVGNTVNINSETFTVPLKHKQGLKNPTVLFTKNKKLKLQNKSKFQSLSHYNYQLRLSRISNLQKAKIAKKSTQKKETSQTEKGFTSLYSLAKNSQKSKSCLNNTRKRTDTKESSNNEDSNRHSAQRAYLRNLLNELFCVIKPEKKDLLTKKEMQAPNKLEIINDAMQTIERLNKRDQQLQYIHRLLKMWNDKLQLCAKVVQKGL